MTAVVVETKPNNEVVNNQYDDIIQENVIDKTTENIETKKFDPVKGTILISEKLKDALATGSKEWGRSKIMIVGEGRAGKTALANSIIGKSFKETDSTLGINQFTCSINQISKGKGDWSISKSHDKEFEAAIAHMIIHNKEKSKGNNKPNDISIELNKNKRNIKMIEI